MAAFDFLAAQTAAKYGRRTTGVRPHQSLLMQINADAVLFGQNAVSAPYGGTEPAHKKPTQAGHNRATPHSKRTECSGDVAECAAFPRPARSPYSALRIGAFPFPTG